MYFTHPANRPAKRRDVTQRNAASLFTVTESLFQFDRTTYGHCFTQCRCLNYGAWRSGDPYNCGSLLRLAALRVRLGGERSFREAFEEVRRRRQEVRAHSYACLSCCASDPECSHGLTHSSLLLFAPTSRQVTLAAALERIRLASTNAKFDSSC
jgi:hypothetical protein